MRYENEALTLAAEGSNFSALCNYACTRLREDHIRWNRRMGPKGDEHALAAQALLTWNDGSVFHAYLFEGRTAMELPWDIGSTPAGNLLIVRGIPVFVSRHRPAFDENEHAQASLGLRTSGSGPTEWVLNATMRRCDRIAVPPAKRTLQDGWADPDVLPRPAISDDEPITMVDYLTEVVLHERHHDVRLPVFSRRVALGMSGRIPNCWSARGTRLVASGA